MKETILAMYSGGLDSVAMLHLLLTSEEYSQYNIHVHHVHIRNIENRSHAEDVAVKLSLQWFRDNGYRRFDNSYSTIGFNMFNNKFLFDTDITYFFGGYIASCDESVTKIAFAATATDYTEDSGSTNRFTRGRDIFKAFVDIGKVIPLEKLTKVETYQLLPEGLRDKYWSCRTPVYVDNKATPCNECKTCKQLNEFGIKNNTLSLV